MSVNPNYTAYNSFYAPFGSVQASAYQYQAHAYISNRTGFSLYMLTNDGVITELPPTYTSAHAFANTEPPHVEVRWERNDGRSAATASNAWNESQSVNKSPKGKDVAPNNFYIKVSATALTKGIVVVNEAAIILADVNHKLELEAYRRNSGDYIRWQMEMIANKYYHPTERCALEDNIFGLVPTAPIQIFANAYDPSIERLYIDINDVLCEVHVAHDHDTAEHVTIALNRAGDNVQTFTIPGFSWGHGDFVEVIAFGTEWLIGSSKEMVFKHMTDRILAREKMKTPEEINAILKRQTLQAEEDIHAADETISRQTNTIKDLREQIKELNAKLNTAESYTENTAKQQMAYSNMYFNQDKLEYERQKMLFDQYVAKQKAEEDRRLAAEKAEADRIAWERTLRKLEEDLRITREKADADQKAFEAKLAADREKAEYERRALEAKMIADREKAENDRKLQEMKLAMESRKAERKDTTDTIQMACTAVSLVASLVAAILTFKSPRPAK